MTELPSTWTVAAGVAACAAISAEGSGREDVRRSLVRLPTGGQFRADDLWNGLLTLLDVGLIREVDGQLHIESTLASLQDVGTTAYAVTIRWLERHQPLWVHTAIGPFSVSYELIPDQDLRRLQRLIANPEEREAALLAVGNKANSDENAATGEAGERHVVEQCQQTLRGAGRGDLATKVRQVSVISDALGYDVTSPDTQERVQRMEVKTSTSAGRTFRCFLSRNEAVVARADPDWALVACRIDQQGDVQTLGWCRFAAVEHLLPHDQERSSTGQGAWSSVQLTLPLHTFNAGLPLAPTTDPSGVPEAAGAR